MPKRIRKLHPQYQRWRYIVTHYDHDPRWSHDFKVFLGDIGPQPSPLHKLWRKGNVGPYTKDNSEWRERINAIGPEWKKLNQAKYRKRSPEKVRARRLKYQFGLTLEQVQQMEKEQGGACRICKKPETKMNKLTGKPQNLSVDHCHETKKNRSLLCNEHNTGMGKFPTVELLCAAIFYLDMHSENPGSLIEKSIATLKKGPSQWPV